MTDVVQYKDNPVYDPVEVDIAKIPLNYRYAMLSSSQQIP